MKKLLSIITLSLLCFSVQLDAKGGGGSSSSFGGGGRSSSSSSSWGSSSKPSTPASTPSKSYSSSSSTSKPSTSAPASKPSTATPQTSSRQVSNVERSKYEAASKSGTAFKTRESAVADFKAKNAEKYTSSYKTEPATRPTYIPQSYSSGGRSYNIIYNPGYGYGYWNGGGPGLGTFLLYSALEDIAMRDRLMAQNNYYVGEPPVYVQPHGVGYWIFSTLLGFIILAIFIGVFVRVFA